MIDVKLPLRTAYYSLLNGNLSYNAVAVPVSTDIKKLVDTKATVYVIISSQSGVDTSTLSSFDNKETIVLDIVAKSATRVNKEIIDNIAGQIMNLVLPAPGRNALPAQPGVQFDCVQLDTDRYLDLVLNASNTVNRRLLSFTQRIRQTGNYTVGAPAATFHTVVTSPDFIDATNYANPALNNQSFNIFFNNTSKFLIDGTDWVHRSGGGFTILIPGFNAQSNSYTLLVFLK